MESCFDFSFHYHWAEGTVPPPWHYEYHIEMVNLQGVLTFTPDYPAQGVPTWTEDFLGEPDKLNRLYEISKKLNLPARQWHPPRRLAVGGSTQILDGKIDGQSFLIPPSLQPADRELLQPFFEAVKSLVPDSIWKILYSRRECYIQEQSK